MGIGGNLDMWAPLVRRLPGRQLIMFDFPGTGGSSLPWWPPSMASNALFTRMLLRKLGYSRVDVIGYSWGGIVAQQLAIQHRSSVRKLVLAGTTFGLGAFPPGPLVSAHMLTPRRYYSRSYFTRIAPEIFGGRSRTHRARLRKEAQRRITRPPSVVGYTSQLLALLSYSSLPALPLISARTLILAGDDDPLVAAINPQIMARLIRRSTLHVIPRAGHLLLLDTASTVAPMIEKFLAS
jgi:pimeloyl-ACP methyl ester carboxylesterase